MLFHLIDGVEGETTGPVSRAAARAVAWCAYLYGHARRLYASVSDMARVAAALLAGKITRGRLPRPFTARDVYRSEWTGLTEPRVVQGAFDCLEGLGWLRSDAGRARAGGRPSVRFHPNPRLTTSAIVGSRGRRNPTGPGDRQDAGAGFVGSYPARSSARVIGSRGVWVATSRVSLPPRGGLGAREALECGAVRRAEREEASARRHIDEC